MKPMKLRLNDIVQANEIILEEKRKRIVELELALQAFTYIDPDDWDNDELPDIILEHKEYFLKLLAKKDK